ncbi:MAG TPA: septation protein SepH [Dermatophilaceae bacterium]
MQDLQLIGVHEDGEHLLLTGGDDERFELPINDALRAAIRRDRPHLGQLQIELDGGLRPRDVQALIRAGASSDEAASRAGWSVEKVHRYEGPILAEREHVAGLAQRVRLRSRSGVSGGGTAPTLSARVTERLKARDVEMTDASWDSWRSQGGPWTVVLTFAAGGRQRQASWSFDLANRTVSAVDDEARWLSEEVQESKGPIPAPRQHPAPGRSTTVYDQEAEGGLRPAAQHEHPDDPLDLMTAMRKRSTARSRRRPGSRGASMMSAKAPAATGDEKQLSTEQSLPLQDTEQSPPQQDPEYGAETTPTRPEPDQAIAVDHVDDNDSPAHQTPAETGEASPERAESSARRDQPKPRPKRPAGEVPRKTGRPSVPAWDEIMFGSRPDVDRSSS